VVDNAPSKSRRLRAPSETVREKAEKAQEAALGPQKPRKTRALAWPFRGLAWLGHRPPLKQLGHGLRWFFSLKPIRIIGIILGLRFVRDSARELKLVNWPTRTQSRRLTTAVIIFSIVFGGLIAIVDLGLGKLFRQILLK